MRSHPETFPNLRSLIAVALVAAAQAMCQEKLANTEPQRRIVVSIPDRKLALIEDGRVVKVYPTAVGAAKSPTPSGTASFSLAITSSEPFSAQDPFGCPSGRRLMQTKRYRWRVGMAHL